MKNADEIKKGLACCAASIYQCEDDCPYREGCRSGEGWMAMNKDALALIQQLEAERDAAVADIRLAFTSHVGACETCKHVENQIVCDNPLGCGYCGDEKCKCNSCDNDYSHWHWRGVQKEG